MVDEIEVTTTSLVTGENAAVSVTESIGPGLTAADSVLDKAESAEAVK